MKNFQPGGLRGRKPDLGGRPQSDVHSYAPKFRSQTERSENKPRFNDRNDREERPLKKDVQLFAAKCTTCGKSCEVPFRPDGTKPVLCRDCFATKNASPANMATSRDRFTNNEPMGHNLNRAYQQRAETPASTKQFELLLKQLAAVETKVNQILELINVSKKLSTALPPVAETVESGQVTETDEVKKIRKPKKVIAKKAPKKVPAKAKKAAKKTK